MRSRVRAALGNPSRPLQGGRELSLRASRAFAFASAEPPVLGPFP